MSRATAPRITAAAALTAVVLLAGATARPAIAEPAATTEPVATAAADPFPHPVLPEESRWPKYAFRVIGAMFVLAAVIGPIVRREFPQDLPPTTHSHDEPPGTSGHHGRTGTRDLSPPDRPH